MNHSDHHNQSNNINILGKEKIKNETVKVCVRVRPMLEHEDTEFWVMDSVNNSISTLNSLQSYKSNEFSRGDNYSSISGKEKDLKKILMDSVYSPQSFAFDKIYDKKSNSQLIYKEICRNITKSVISGYNGTIFMYGQTTSGKTFTMLGTPNSPGLLPCGLRDIFNMIQKENNPEAFNVYCSYIEIYNENLRDLLTDASNLKLIDDSKYGVIVVGAKRVKIKSFEDGISLKDYGEENRKYRETMINEYSSRSHTIFQIFVETDLSLCNPNDNKEGTRYSCLNLVDLAGSERLTDYDTKTEAFGETGYINKSLFVLANVINKLAEGKNTHIPYRDSKLTRLLSQALGGNSLTAIICTVSPAAINYYQTLSTLRFATRAKIVKTKAKVNEYMNEKGAIEYYKNEIKKLQEELKNKTNNNNISMNIPFNINMNSMSSKFNENYSNSNYSHKDLIDYAKKTNESLINELDSFKEKYFSEKEKNQSIQMKLKNLQNSHNFQTSNEALFTDKLNKTNPIPGFNFDYMNYSSNYISNRMMSPMFNVPYYQNNFRQFPSTNYFNPLCNLNNNFNLFDQNSITFSNTEAFFIENMMNKIFQYVHDKKEFVTWSEEANKINGENELLDIQSKYKNRLMDSFYKYFKLVEDNSRPGFKFINDQIVEIEEKPEPNYFNKSQKKKSKESIGSVTNNDINNHIPTFDINNSNRDREVLKKSFYENNKSISNIENNLNNSNHYNNSLIEDEEIIKKINEKSIFDNINLVFKLYSFENKENNLRILKRTYEEKVETLEKKMDLFKSCLENFYRKQIQNNKNSHMDNLNNLNENFPIIMITSEHNEKLKTLRELYHEKLNELEQNFFENLKIITSTGKQ